MSSNPVTNSSLRLLAFILMGLALGLFLTPLKADATSPVQAGPIQVNINTARVRYREGISFQISGRTAEGGPITQAQLKVKYGKRGREFSYEVPLVDGTGSHLVADETESLTTGMPLTYYWLLGDGKTQLQTLAQTVVYDDNRHPWRQREGDHLTVRWYDGDDRYGDLMYQLGTDTLATYKRRFTIDPTQQIYITIYGSSQAYHTAFPEAPSWSGGLTRYGGVEIIVIAPQNLNASVFIGEGIPHELSHAALYQFMGSPAPRWLDEGFAVYNQNTIDIKSYDDLLREAYTSNALIPLAQLNTRWPSDGDLALLAYAEGRSVVTFLINTYDAKVWTNLLDQLRRHNVDDAMQACFGMNLADMEKLWKRKVLGNDKTVVMPTALKVGPVASQVTEADLQAKSASRFPARANTDDGPGWLVLLVGVLIVVGLAGCVSFLLIRRYRRMNALEWEEMPRHRVLQEQQYLKSRLGMAYQAPPLSGPTASSFEIPANPGFPPSPTYQSSPSASPFNPASLPTPLASSSYPPLATAYVPSASPAWPDPASTARSTPSVAPTQTDDPFDLIMASFGQTQPSSPPPPAETNRPQPSSSFLNLDPYGLNFDAPRPSKDDH